MTKLVVELPDQDFIVDQKSNVRKALAPNLIFLMLLFAR